MSPSELADFEADEKEKFENYL